MGAKNYLWVLTCGAPVQYYQLYYVRDCKHIWDSYIIIQLCVSAMASVYLSP